MPKKTSSKAAAAGTPKMVKVTNAAGVEGFVEERFAADYEQYGKKKSKPKEA